jgi:organic hydroperoxide reductase OsmC/OhrA
VYARTRPAQAREATVTSGIVQHTASARATAGRDGPDPEQLFAAAWAARFLEAIRLAAVRLDVSLPASLAVEAEVDLCATDGPVEDDPGRGAGTGNGAGAGVAGTAFLRARFLIRIPGLERDVADALVDLARRTCAYTRATRGNVAVTIRVA